MKDEKRKKKLPLRSVMNLFLEYLTKNFKKFLKKGTRATTINSSSSSSNLCV